MIRTEFADGRIIRTESAPKRTTPKRTTKVAAGTRIGFWTLLEYLPGSLQPKQHARWKCVCVCGGRRIVRADNLLGGRSNSCGCVTKPKQKRVP